MMKLNLQLHAHKKGMGSTRNGRDSESKRLGPKRADGQLALAGNTWRARWKYRYFTGMNWMQALWIQVKGFLFEKNPSLS